MQAAARLALAAAVPGTGPARGSPPWPTSLQACSFNLPNLTALLPTGGGAKNPVWTELRRRELGVPVSASTQAEAAYGSALLAKRGAALAAPSPTALVM